MKKLLTQLIIAMIVIATIYGCQKSDLQKDIALSSGYAQGKDGFKYVLTQKEFSTPYDIPIEQVRTIYGEETVIADWNDLKANFEDDLSGFLHDIGLAEANKHESFYVKNDSQYLFMGERPYMVTGLNPQKHSPWIYLDTMDDYNLVAAMKFDTGRVLLKIPIHSSNTAKRSEIIQ